MTSKNQIILYNETFGKYQLMVQNSLEIFNREDMTNTLLTIEDKEYNYDDIISINVINLCQNAMNDLPHSLESLIIKRTTLVDMIIPKECVKLKHIEIRDSNLTSVPEIDFLPNLETIIFENASIKQLPKTFPSSLQSINLSGNCLDEFNTNIRSFPKHIPIILCKNGFTEKEKYDGYNILYGTQYFTPKQNIVTDYALQKNNAHDIIEEALKTTRYNPEDLNIVYHQPFDNAYFERNLPRPTPYRARHPKRDNNIFNSGQTVHISSICNSITKSLYKINELTRNLYHIRLENMLIDEFIDEFYTKKSKNIFERAFHFIKSPIQNAAMANCVKRWTEYRDVHTKTDISYGELLAKVWLLIKNHPQKQDFITNVKIELKASVGVCFTGRFNRLVNSLIGFVDGITVGISIQEQLQLEIGKLIAKLGKKEISYDECYKTIEKMFDDPDVKEDETVTADYKQSWLDALEDYKPELDSKKDDTKLKELITETKEPQDNYYYDPDDIPNAPIQEEQAAAAFEPIAHLEENNYMNYDETNIF